ncbi:hypothetical protein CEUSTIGMA_g7153.t1 [Chlamydomonas eustigma]|uniref:Uncharacterized protein n=1 Tax=Chlamydomonas eustigma TaxID=1157962 RepID=A0A250XA27_9CHLO|nr:hypothetical protein CEUSTIGMA_g7153.t1 [Chlamydomonas eustigma]|eukprot:GAX79712.1 hypothetical protein CEUSTIGMA_g7153.t1 [Chlamydomonas eustigma]
MTLNRTQDSAMTTTYSSSPHVLTLYHICMGFSHFWQPSCLALRLPCRRDGIVITTPLSRHQAQTSRPPEDSYQPQCSNFSTLHTPVKSSSSSMESGPSSVLRITSPEGCMNFCPCCYDSGLRQLWHCSHNLAHLQVDCPCIVDLSWLQNLSHTELLMCFSLRGCQQLSMGKAMQCLVQHAPNLRALDLSGLGGLGDEAAAFLTWLPNLEVYMCCNSVFVRMLEF